MVDNPGEICLAVYKGVTKYITPTLHTEIFSRQKETNSHLMIGLPL